jgi:hypothetical protein
MMILVKVAMRLMATAWAVFIIFLVIPGAPGWLSDLSMALFAASMWDLLVAVWFSWRRYVELEMAWQRRHQAEFERCEAAIAMVRMRERNLPLEFRRPDAAVIPVPVHVHEVGAEVREGVRMGGHLITVRNDRPCIICAEKAGYHDYGAY